MRIAVVYADPTRQIQEEFQVEAPMTVDEVLRLAADDSRFAGIDVLASAVGIFGLVVARSRLLADGDRVEIYRPLAVDPKQARRRRASRRGRS